MRTSLLIAASLAVWQVASLPVAPSAWAHEQGASPGLYLSATPTREKDDKARPGHKPAPQEQRREGQLDRTG